MASDAMERLRRDLAGRLLRVESDIAYRGLHMPCVTLIVRDPDYPGMVIAVTNDPDLSGAFRQVEENAR